MADDQMSEEELQERINSFNEVVKQSKQLSEDCKRAARLKLPKGYAYIVTTLKPRSKHEYFVDDYYVKNQLQDTLQGWSQQNGHALDHYRIFKTSGTYLQQGATPVKQADDSPTGTGEWVIVMGFDTTKEGADACIIAEHFHGILTAYNTDAKAMREISKHAPNGEASYASWKESQKVMFGFDPSYPVQLSKVAHVESKVLDHPETLSPSKRGTQHLFEEPSVRAPADTKSKRKATSTSPYLEMGDAPRPSRQQPFRGDSPAARELQRSDLPGFFKSHFFSDGYEQYQASPKPPGRHASATLRPQRSKQSLRTEGSSGPIPGIGRGIRLGQRRDMSSTPFSHGTGSDSGKISGLEFEEADEGA